MYKTTGVSQVQPCELNKYDRVNAGSLSQL